MGKSGWPPKDSEKFQYRGHRVYIYKSHLHYLGHWMIVIDDFLPEVGPKKLREARRHARFLVSALTLAQLRKAAE